MSYRCEKCDSIHKGSELKYISEVREVSYRQFVPKFDQKDRKKKPTFHQAHKGLEIVKEQKLCSKCHEEVGSSDPAISDKPKDVNYFSKHFKSTEGPAYQSGTGNRTVKSFRDL